MNRRLASSVRGLLTGSSIAFCLFGASSASAAIQNWLPGGATNTWSTSGIDLNWDAGVTWTNGNDAVFGTAADNITLGTGITALSLTFDVSGYSISGNSLTLTGPTVKVTNSADSASISSIITGTVGLTKTGAGKLTLSGANTYTGTATLSTTVSAGTLEISGSGTLGTGASTTAISIASGATFRYASSAVQDLTQQCTLNGTFEIASGQVNLAGGNNQLGAADNAGGLLLIRDGGILNNKLTTTAHSVRTDVELRNGGKLTSTGTTNTSGFGDFFYNVDGKIIGTGSGNQITASTLGINSATNFSKTLTLNTVSSTDSLLVTSAIIDKGGLGGALTKTGAGTVTLSGANTYAGATTVSGGTLLANNTTGSGLGTSAVTVASGATLGGTGTIKPGSANGLSISGILAPGAGIGNLTIDLSATTGKVTLAGTGSFKFELGVAGAAIGTIGTGDLIALTGASASDFTFANNTIDFSGGGQAGWYKLLDTSLDSTTWTGLTFDPITGVISSGLTASNLASGLAGQFVMGTATNGGNVGDIYLQAVPEPGALVSLLGGCGVLLGLRRRRPGA